MNADSSESEVTEEQLDRIEAGEEHPPKPDFLSEDEWQGVISARTPTVIRMAGTGHARCLPGHRR